MFLAIQDTSELKIYDDGKRTGRALGKIKKGNAFGVLLHPLLALDADSGTVLGLAGGSVWTRSKAVQAPQRPTPAARQGVPRAGIATAEQAKQTLAAARLITIIDDREGDFYAHWALTPAANVHLLTRLMNDHALVKGGTVRMALTRLPVVATAVNRVAPAPPTVLPAQLISRCASAR